MITSEQKRLVRESFSLIREAAVPIGLLFYGRLFDLEPSLRSLFKNDIRLQTRKLMDTLNVAVESLENFEAVRLRLTDLGRRHAETYQVQPQHYDLLRSALLWAFSHALEGEFYPEVKEAWFATITEINEAMKS
jgi:hemoglobin-like flavoprotein